MSLYPILFNFCVKTFPTNENFTDSFKIELLIPLSELIKVLITDIANYRFGHLRFKLKNLENYLLNLESSFLSKKYDPYFRSKFDLRWSWCEHPSILVTEDNIPILLPDWLNRLTEWKRHQFTNWVDFLVRFFKTFSENGDLGFYWSHRQRVHELIFYMDYICDLMEI